MIDLDLEGKRAVVTGASLGIGAASVRLLADHGADVIFCARNKNAIQELSKYKPEGKGSVKGLIADMGKRIQLISSSKKLNLMDRLISW